ncbi:hypothetical protein GGR57DRAFT_506594 [Xylariaceae sp. FL1272]|nr:hypothetical protein GGR57DRAFT_506594 [Xylariaceae sp. FL1272]
MGVTLPGYADDLQPWCIAVVTTMTVLSLVSVVLRLIARWQKKQQLGWDDYMIVFSLLWNFIVVGFIAGMIQHGMGLHIELAGIDNAILIAKFLVVAEILYVFNLVFTKLSILFMYYRIFRFDYIKRASYAIATFVILWVITITFLFIFICVPVEKLWYPQLEGHCINQVGTWIANAASTILSDLAILLLPLPQIWKLQLKTGTKVAVSLAFGLGFFVVFASAYRFTVLFSYSALDPTYTLAPTVVWTEIEMAAGIISACLPTMVPAIKFFARLLGLGKLVSLSTTFRSKGSTFAMHSSSHQQLSSNHAPSRLDGLGKDGDFHRLSDDASFGKLRPDDNRVAYTVAAASRHKDTDSNSDEIPLHTIRVQRGVKQTRS